MKSNEFLYLGIILLVTYGGIAGADGGVTFTDIAANGGAGISYHRTPSPRTASFAALVSVPFYTQAQFVNTATGSFGQKGRGAPGVALLDFDGDGDLDVYVTNGPGTANSLYSNQYQETGQVTFLDVAAAAGVEATAQDSTGVCFGDIDNDGDHDLYVVATGQPNVLFENQGDGTFQDVTSAAGDVAGDGRNAVACSMADVDNDGLLDIVVGNSYDSWEHRLPHRPGPTYDKMEESYLFRNAGANVFVDESFARGVEDVSNMTGPGLSGGGYTWALATADYDLDGDVDLLFGDNQGPPPANAAEERGYLRLFQNDGNGFFTEVTNQADLDVWGGWMGMDFGDFNCDGHLDFFATDLGFISNAASRWFLGQPGGTFVDSASFSLGGVNMTPFGWGVSIFDYDNDGDGDIVYHGGMRSPNVYVADNPGVVLQNTGEGAAACSGTFDWDSGAILRDHRDRMVQGVAAGDLNGDGFEDVVSVSDVDIDGVLLLSMVSGPFALRPPSGGPFDPVAAYEAIFAPVGGGWFNLNIFRPSGSVLNDEHDGTLAVELNSGDNGNGWVEVTLLGSAGILGGGGVVNRDGIGAVVSFTPEGGKTSLRPIIGGASYASQDALPANFGLGSAARGTAEILWPGGVRNCLHDVASTERVLMPHIPCSFDGEWSNFGLYNACVMQALNTYKNAGFIDEPQRNRLRDSAREAFEDGACTGSID